MQNLRITTKTPNTHSLPLPLQIQTPIFKAVRPSAYRNSVQKLFQKVYGDELQYLKKSDFESGICEIKDTSTLFLAMHKHECIGSLEFKPLLQVQDPGAFSPHFKLLDPQTLTKTVIGSKLIVDPEFRGGLGIQIMKYAFAHCLTEGIQHVFLNCYSHLIPLYLRMGFKMVQEKAEDSTFGTTSILRLDPFDMEHLRQCRSPLYPLIKRHRRNNSH